MVACQDRDDQCMVLADGCGFGAGQTDVLSVSL